MVRGTRWHCLKNGADLVDGGVKYNIGPVFTGCGLAVTANCFAVIKKLVFEDKVTTMSELIDALNANWEGYEELRAKAQAVPKYGNDIDYVDSIAKELADYYYHDVTSYKDYYGHTFTTAFMGISHRQGAGCYTRWQKGNRTYHRRGISLHRH